MTTDTVLANKASHGEHGNCHGIEYYYIWKAVARPVARAVRFVERRGRDGTRPASAAPALRGLMADLTRSQREVLAENALLRQQRSVARRQVTRPKLRPGDRLRLRLLPRLAQYWRDTTLLINPEPVLRWHRAGFRLFWRRKMRAPFTVPRLAPGVGSLITRLARENRLWDAARIRGELFKLAIRVRKRTVQKYMRRARGPRPTGQRWATFVQNPSPQIWACDFLQPYDVLFRPPFAFCIVALESREVLWGNVPRSPTAAWVAQQLRNATLWGTGATFLIRDNDGKFGEEFDRAATGIGIRVVPIPPYAPNCNARCERLLGSVRGERLDHMLIVTERQPYPSSPSIEITTTGAGPIRGSDSRCRSPDSGRGLEFPVLGRLQHVCRLAA